MPTAIKIRLPATFKQQLTTKHLKSNSIYLIIIIIILKNQTFKKLFT